jgi:hypothetical protein
LVCYTCGDPASAQCSECHRYICGVHTGFSVVIDGIICSPCQDWRAARWREKQQAEARERNAQRCAFCGSVPGGVGYRRPCAICKRFFCGAHGERSEMKEIGDSYGPNKCHRWTRCCEHPRQKSRRSLVSAGSPGSYEPADEITEENW